MHKRIILILNLLFLTINLISIEPQRTVVLWDLHEVILKKDWSQLTKISLKGFLSPQFFRKLKRDLIHQFFKLIHVKSKGTDVSVEEFIWVAQQHNHEHLIEIMRNLQNAQKINPGILEIIKDLYAAGCVHYVGSNIGASCFKELTDPIKYPQFKELFSYFNLTNPQIVSINPDSPHNVIKKPNTTFFTNYLKMNNIDLTTTRVIFIDDKLENIEAARKLNFIAVHFKNPQQLRKELQKLGVLS